MRLKRSVCSLFPPRDVVCLADVSGVTRNRDISAEDFVVDGSRVGKVIVAE